MAEDKENLWCAIAEADANFVVQASFLSADHEHKCKKTEADFVSPPPCGNVSYGTAGFRMEGRKLSRVAFRCGVLAALRSKCLAGEATGLVVTASHNPVRDNGVKLIDTDGGMLHMSWEKHAEAVVGAHTKEDLVSALRNLWQVEGGDVSQQQQQERKGKVFVARDTRPSGEVLLRATIQGIESTGAEVVGNKCTVRTTPQLHWQVLMNNKGKACEEEDYFAKLREGSAQLLSNCESKLKHFVIDCACGVGALKIERVFPQCVAALGTDICIKNKAGVEAEGGVLNDQCGADFVQKEKALPRTFDSNEIGPECLCASLDGDADRVVFFSTNSTDKNSSKMSLLDGDKILCLIASHLKAHLDKLHALKPAPTFGIIQTAYANGSSTRFLESELGLKVVKTKTGVKHLHKAAVAFDLSVYFEANGHGTVLFSDAFLSRLALLRDHDGDNQSAKHLLEVAEIVNPSIGDALSIVLLVYVILTQKNWTHHDWCDLYRDVPSRMLKCKVPDRSLIKTKNAEQQVEDPKELQDQIDIFVNEVELGRAFVRPSGTEDIVRVYAEAATQVKADQLAENIQGIVSQYFSSS